MDTRHNPDPGLGVTPPHQPVLYHEIIHAIRPENPGFYVDATIGAGGHAWGILEASSPAGRLLGLDRDPQALDLARRKLSPYGERAVLVQASYTTLPEQLAALGWPSVQGVLIDLGVSSMQLDTPERGFSFLSDGPLDMRFGPDSPQRAADLVNTLPEADLANIFWRYGEEPQARRLAKAIVRARPFATTRQLAEAIARASAYHGGRIHPATRAFQALRIAVNQELDTVQEVLPMAVAALAPGGRLAVISFHSLEDRIVKQFFRLESRDCICPPEKPICDCGHRASIKEINRRPILGDPAEISVNPRARSAKLRVAEKLDLA